MLHEISRLARVATCRAAGQITNDVLDATEAALRRAGGDQVSLLFFFSEFIKRNKDQCRLPPKYEKEERCIQWYLLQTDSVSNG